MGCLHPSSSLLPAVEGPTLARLLWTAHCAVRTPLYIQLCIKPTAAVHTMQLEVMLVASRNHPSLQCSSIPCQSRHVSNATWIKYKMKKHKHFNDIKAYIHAPISYRLYGKIHCGGNPSSNETQAFKLPISIFVNTRKCIQCNTHFNTHSQPHEHALYESSQFCSRNIQLFRLRMIISWWLELEGD